MSEQLALELEFRPALGVEDFLVAPCNREAIAWIDRWPDWPAPALTIHGPAGCGKTHMAQVWRARSGARIVGDVAAAAPNAAQSSGACWIVDDASAGLDEREFLHFFNLVAEGGGHMLITARTAPARWTIALADLRSRLVAAPAVAVGRPDDGLIGAVLVKLFADRQLGVGAEVLTYILARMERSFAAAHALVAALDRHALATRRRITIPLARDVMEKLNAIGDH
jgi:chromosomal replication initiation ATPase DnaA